MSWPLNTSRVLHTLQIKRQSSYRAHRFCPLSSQALSSPHCCQAVQQLLLGHDQRNCIFNLLLCIFLFFCSFSYLSNTPTCWYWDSSANQIISVVAFPTSATSQKYKSHESSLFCTNQIGRSSTKLLKKSATESS